MNYMQILEINTVNALLELTNKPEVLSNICIVNHVYVHINK